MLTRNKDELELIEDDENTFTGDQTDADDDADGENLTEVFLVSLILDSIQTMPMDRYEYQQNF